MANLKDMLNNVFGKKGEHPIPEHEKVKLEDAKRRVDRLQRITQEYFDAQVNVYRASKPPASGDRKGTK